ncbi:MAG: hypothetical protein ABIQ98_07870 [Sphingomicrobium sp.]
MHHYHAFGLRIESELALPELHPGDGGACDVSVRIATAAAGERPTRWIEGAGNRVILNLDDIRFEVTDGKRILILAPPDTSQNDIRVWLMGTVMAALLNQRGYFALHGNMVALPGGGAAAFSGTSGAGKSTIAGLLERDGFRVLGDDLCAIQLAPDGRPMIHAGIPRLKLWGETLDLLGRPSGGLERVATSIRKFHVPLGSHQEEGSLDPIALERIYLLDRSERPGEPLIQPLDGASAAGAVLANAFRWGIGQLVAGDGSRTQFDQALSIARHARVFRLARRWGTDQLFGEAEAIAAHLRNSDADGGAGS